MGQTAHAGAPTGLAQKPTDGTLELGLRDRSLELRLDAAVAADEKRPRLARQTPLADPLIFSLGRIVVSVDLDVDEADPAACEGPTNAVDDVDDGAAGPARAESGGRRPHHAPLMPGARFPP